MQTSRTNPRFSASSCLPDITSVLGIKCSTTEHFCIITVSKIPFSVNILIILIYCYSFILRLSPPFITYIILHIYPIRYYQFWAIIKAQATMQINTCTRPGFIVYYNSIIPLPYSTTFLTLRLYYPSFTIPHQLLLPLASALT